MELSTTPDSDVQVEITKLEEELNNLADAIAKSGGSKFLVEKLQAKASHLEDLRNATKHSEGYKPKLDEAWLRLRVLEELNDLPNLLNDDPLRARVEILKD